MLKSLKFIIPLLLFVALAVLLGAGLGRDPKEVPSPLIDKPAPAFKLSTLADPARQVQRDDLLGTVWMLNVWASWCVACRVEHPVLVEFARRNPVPIYGLNYKDEPAAGQQWLDRLGNPYRASLVDRDGRVGIDFGVYGVPETFIVDKRGVIRFKQIGPVTPEVLTRKIEPLLQALNAEPAGIPTRPPDPDA